MGGLFASIAEDIDENCKELQGKIHENEFKIRTLERKKTRRREEYTHCMNEMDARAKTRFIRDLQRLDREIQRLTVHGERFQDICEKLTNVKYILDETEQKERATEFMEEAREALEGYDPSLFQIENDRIEVHEEMGGGDPVTVDLEMIREMDEEMTRLRLSSLPASPGTGEDEIVADLRNRLIQLHKD